MAILAGLHYRRPILSNSLQSNRKTTVCYLFFSRPSCRIQWFSSSTEFGGENAYDLLGVSESSLFDEIKASFRKLAKETHPDLAHSNKDSTGSQRFIQILEAYEILSDTEKRAHYDKDLLSTYASHITKGRWKLLNAGSGYFDVLEGEFNSAIHAAHYGPLIERGQTPEVLHLVSGHDPFGMVCIVKKIPALSHACNEKLTFASLGLGMGQSVGDARISMNSDAAEDAGTSQMQAKNIKYHTSDAYKDLELHVSGKVVAVATRIPPESFYDGIQNEDSQDQRQVFLSSYQGSMYVSHGISKDSLLGGAVGLRIPLGTITGLGTNPEEGSCFVYDSNDKNLTFYFIPSYLRDHTHWAIGPHDFSWREWRFVARCSLWRRGRPTAPDHPAKMLTPGAIRSGLRISGVIELGPLELKAATTGEG
ncbi:hypothetical protein PVL29_026832 [Vitis rotundifolia]|uniref:J domain-containing protein n=1 Tax=Vitis rotundifolia TaxID=103349 RepID=A0AA39D4L5_VITRO|nr:hypothetical protein PVL29_026832 [Vitis rotundifolia]